LRRDEAGAVRAVSCDVPALTAYLARVVENDGLTVEVWNLRGLVGAIGLNLTLILILCAIVVVVVVAFLAAVFGVVISHVAVGAVLATTVILLTIFVSFPCATITIIIAVVIVIVLVLVVVAFLGGMAVLLTIFAVLLLAAVVTTILLSATSASAVLLATATAVTVSFTASHFRSLEMNVIETWRLF
jgi:hypothetical protein